MTSVLSLSHLALPSRDPDNLRKWYVEHFGCKAHGSQLWCGGSVITILAGTPIENENWHFGFRLESPEDLRDWHKALQDKSAKPSSLQNYGDYQTFSLKDPEGNDIEFFFEQEPSAE